MSGTKIIKALCIAEDADRPTVATFIGLARAGVEMTVMCRQSASGRDAMAAEGIRLLDFTLRGSYDRAGRRRLREDLTRGRYDILHLLGNRALQNGLAAVQGLPTRVIAYRGIVGNVSFASPVSWLRVLNPRIDRIVCVCNAVRDYYLSMRPKFLRMPAHRPVTIYKGHSLDWYTAEPADLAELGVASDDFVIACVANYRPRKGIEVLIDALAILPATMRVRLLLVGHMDDPGLTRKIDASPVRDRIQRVGYRTDAPALVAASDVFVLPSIKREGLARAVIEAMAYGVPPVVTDCGGSPELVVDGVSGLVVPVGDAGALGAAIARLHDDAPLRRPHGCRGTGSNRARLQNRGDDRANARAVSRALRWCRGEDLNLHGCYPTGT